MPWTPRIGNGYRLGPRTLSSFVHSVHYVPVGSQAPCAPCQEETTPCSSCAQHLPWLPLIIHTLPYFQCFLDQNLGRERIKKLGRLWCSVDILFLGSFPHALLILMPNIHFPQLCPDTNKSRATSTLNLQSFKWYLLFSVISLLLVMYLNFVILIKVNGSPKAK